MNRKQKPDYSKQQPQFADDNVEEQYLTTRYQNYKQRARNMKEDPDDFKYFEFELIQIEDLEEFREYNNLTFINIKDVTTIIKGIQKINDMNILMPSKQITHMSK